MLALCALMLAPAPAPAQALRDGPKPALPETKAPDPKADAKPRVRAPRDKRTQLEGLYAALKAAPDDDSAKRISDRLDQLFADSGSASADLLMARATIASEAKDYDLALQLLDQIVAVEPDYLAARSRRATIHYLRDEYAEALADIREVLAREPRHYSMLLGLSLILRELGEDQRALDAARRALAVYPRFEAAKDIEKELAGKVDGQDI